MQPSRVRLGELLVRAGLISDAQLEEALAEQSRVGKRLGSLIVELGLVSETQVTQILSQQLSVPWVSLHHIDFSRQLLDLVPIDLVERFCLIPIYVRRVRGLGDALYVAMDDPTNGQALTEVAERSGLHVRAMIAPPSDIRAAIRAYYGIGDEAPPQGSAPDGRGDGSHESQETDDVKTGVHSREELTSPKEDSGHHEVSAPEAPAAPPPGPAEPASGPLVEAPSRPVEAVRAVPRDGEKGGAGTPRRMIALTLLDGTTIQVPSKGRGARRAERAATVAARDETAASSAPSQAREAPDESPRAPPGATAGAEAKRPSESPGDQLTARDLVAALRAQAHGADASDILGQNVRWEAMFAALLTLLLKKNIILDREFVEEFKKL